MTRVARIGLPALGLLLCSAVALRPGQARADGGEKGAPTLDPTSAAAVTVVDNEQAWRVPLQHQPESIAPLAPGVGPGPLPSVRGGLRRFSRFLVDGLDVTDIVTGGLTSPVNFDSIEQFTIVTGGMDAEYNALGMAQSMVSRTGGNSFSVDASATLQPTFLSAPATYSLPSPVSDGVLLYDSRPQAARALYSGNLNVGGPIVKDRLWFFASFQFDYGRGTTPIPALPWYPGLAMPSSRTSDAFTYLGRARLTWQATRSTRLSLSFNIDRNSISNAGPAASPFVDPATVAPEAERRIDRGGEWLALLWDTQITGSLLFQLRTGFTHSASLEDTQRRTDGTPDRVTPSHTLRTDPGDPVLGPFNGFTYLNSSQGWNDQTKWRVQLDPSLLWVLGGRWEHIFKGGVQLAYQRYTHNAGVAGGQQYTDTVPGLPCDPKNPVTSSSCSQLTEYPESRPNPDGSPGSGLTTTSQALTMGFYLQHRYIIKRWLTTVLGVRADVGLLYDGDGRKLATLWGGGPRVSAIYDLLHDGTTLIQAYFGQHFDVGNAFVADRGNPTPVANQSQWNAATGGFQPVSSSGGAGPAFAPDVKAPRLLEAGGGLHREVLPRTAVGADYAFRLYTNLWVTQETNAIWDPGGTRIVGYADGTRQLRYQLATPDDARRTYHGVDLWVKGTPGNWFVLASYTLAFASGTVTDYFDGFGANPRLAHFFDGPLPDTYRHDLKGAVSYHFGFGLDVGVRFEYLNGAPQWQVYQSPQDGSFSLYKSPRGSDTGTKVNDPTAWAAFQLPDLLNLGLELRYSLERLTRQRIDLSGQMFNVLDVGSVTQVDPRAGADFGMATGRLQNLLAQLLLRYRY